MLFFKNFFSEKTHKKFIENFLEKFLQISNLELHFDVEQQAKEKNKFSVDIYGKDEAFLLEKNGCLLYALQIFLSGALKNRIKQEDEKKQAFVQVDSQNFLDSAEKQLLDLACSLKKEVLKNNKSVFIRRPLNAFQRRKIHQLLTKDGKVQTYSIGEGALKKIKISPIGGKGSYSAQT